jgi:hypothetical protein
MEAIVAYNAQQIGPFYRSVWSALLREYNIQIPDPTLGFHIPICIFTFEHRDCYERAKVCIERLQRSSVLAPVRTRLGPIVHRRSECIAVSVEEPRFEPIRDRLIQEFERHDVPTDVLRFPCAIPLADELCEDHFDLVLGAFSDRRHQTPVEADLNRLSVLQKSGDRWRPEFGISLH